MANSKHRLISKRKKPPTYKSNAGSYRRPFWLPAISYYFLVVAVAIGMFFLVWGILLEGGDQTPWIPAGLLASLILISAVVVREVFLRRARQRYLIDSQRLDRTLSKIPRRKTSVRTRPKFTLQQNTFLLNQIEEKSEAARVLKRLPEGHLEVFEICNEYLNYTKKELEHIDLNSPRYPAVKNGRKKVRKFHKYHLLTWAEIESKSFTRESKDSSNFPDKIGFANKALNVIDGALKFYPNDNELLASKEAIGEYISRMNVANQIERAERAEFVGDKIAAIGEYREALFLLGRQELSNREKEELAKRINGEIENLRGRLDDDKSELLSDRGNAK